MLKPRSLHHARRAFVWEFCTHNWFVDAVADESHGQLTVYTNFDLPEPLKDKLATWQGWPVSFVSTGWVCLD